MLNTIRFRLTGRRPLLMHGDMLADPLNPITKKHKAITSKRTKTDDDHEAIEKSEWRAGMYYDDELGPYVPDVNVEASLVAGGKLSKQGSELKRSVEVVEPMIRLDYDGPRDIEGLWEKGFRDVRSVVISRRRLMRYRPMFRHWGCEFDLAYDPERIDRDVVIRCMEAAGAYIGIGDYRPKFGRFDAEVIA